ncbi:MAG TPA: serine/threonine-protein kinase [Planctomycetota bacterium]|nr:serine/threonine-protein kinase [Planctomycetota bacterium]
MTDPTLLLDFAHQRGLIGDQALSTLRAQPSDRLDDALADALIADAGLSPEQIALLAREAELSAQPPTVAGYEVGRRLGAGGGGTVWRARRIADGREVALKLVIAVDDRSATRFLREAAAAASLRHANVVAYLDAGRDGMRMHLAMELVDGADAARFAASRGGRLPERLALKIVRDAAAGVQAFADAGLVHRDLKPANILITRDGVAKVADLGAVQGEADAELTRTMALVGTPAFMAPEQARGDAAIDHRADIYALGATLYALVVGAAPFTGATPWAVVEQVAEGAFPEPRDALPEIGDATRIVILAATARDPRRRYASATQLREDCVAALAGHFPPHAQRLRQAATAPPPAAEPGPRTRAWAPALAVAAAIALGLAIGHVSGGPGRAVQAAATTARDDAGPDGWTRYLASYPDGPHRAEAQAALAAQARLASARAERARAEAAQRAERAALEAELAGVVAERAAVAAQLAELDDGR